MVNEIFDSLIYAEVTKATESQRTMKFDLKREADRQLHYEKMQMIWEDTVLDRYADLVTSITYLRKQNERENLIASMEELRVPYDPTRAEEFYNMELPSQPRSKDLCNTLPKPSFLSNTIIQHPYHLLKYNCGCQRIKYYRRAMIIYLPSYLY